MDNITLIIFAILGLGFGILIGVGVHSLATHDADREAQCTSLYGVYGGGKCYEHGKEIEL